MALGVFASNYCILEALPIGSFFDTPAGAAVVAAAAAAPPTAPGRGGSTLAAIAVPPSAVQVEREAAVMKDFMTRMLTD